MFSPVVLHYLIFRHRYDRVDRSSLGMHLQWRALSFWLPSPRAPTARLGYQQVIIPVSSATCPRCSTLRPKPEALPNPPRHSVCAATAVPLHFLLIGGTGEEKTSPNTTRDPYALGVAGGGSTIVEGPNRVGAKRQPSFLRQQRLYYGIIHTGRPPMRAWLVRWVFHEFFLLAPNVRTIHA